MPPAACCSKPPAPRRLPWLTCSGLGSSGNFGQTTATDTLLIASGAVTAIPLLLFAIGARRLPLATMGFLQYVAPSLSFLVAIVYYGEPMNLARLLAFIAIWTGLALYSADCCCTAGSCRRAAIIRAPSPVSLPHEPPLRRGRRLQDRHHRRRQRQLAAGRYRQRQAHQGQGRQRAAALRRARPDRTAGAAEAQAEDIETEFLWEVCPRGRVRLRGTRRRIRGAQADAGRGRRRAAAPAHARRSTFIARARAASARRRRRSCRPRWPGWKRSASRRWPSSAWWRN